MPNKNNETIKTLEKNRLLIFKKIIEIINLK